MKPDQSALLPLPLNQAYLNQIKAGHIESDPAQVALVGKLDQLLLDLDRKRLSTKGNSLGWLFGKGQTKGTGNQGIYIWGGVGRGKSMLMDMFFAAAPQRRKRRVHFNDFMQDAQNRIHEYRQAYKAGKVREEDPIPPVAKDLANEAALLCFDEFSVTDIADAMILGRLFSSLFQHGITIVATSNVAPEDLYRDGLNRDLFLPFVELLQSKLEVIRLGARTDYRLEKLKSAPVYFSPLNSKTEKALEAAWERVTGGANAPATELELKGRKIPIPRAVSGNAWLTYEILCEEPRSSADYLAIARNFHTVFIAGIKSMSGGQRNEAKRFILLIDTLYDNHTRLVASAEAAPDELYSGKSGTEAFEFQRTVSRLHEMQSESYIG